MTASYPDLGEFLQSTRLEEIMDNFSLFIKTKSTSNHTMAYWLLYIEMVQVLLLFIRATRENDWQLHLSAVRSMLPWFFAADRVNYARYGSIYWLEMISMDRTHPRFFSHDKTLSRPLNIWVASYHSYLPNAYLGILLVYSGALQGVVENWTCQRQDRYGFSSTACDQTMEQTFNRDSKTKGGIVGFTLNRTAVK